MMRPNTPRNMPAVHQRFSFGLMPAEASLASCPPRRQELHRLRREVRSLREDRKILKKAAAFFAKENK